MLVVLFVRFVISICDPTIGQFTANVVTFETENDATVRPEGSLVQPVTATDTYRGAGSSTGTGQSKTKRTTPTIGAVAIKRSERIFFRSDFTGRCVMVAAYPARVMRDDIENVQSITPLFMRSVLRARRVEARSANVN
jgi:hypothetical protein